MRFLCGYSQGLRISRDVYTSSGAYAPPSPQGEGLKNEEIRVILADPDFVYSAPVPAQDEGETRN